MLVAKRGIADALGGEKDMSVPIRVNGPGFVVRGSATAEDPGASGWLRGVQGGSEGEQKKVSFHGLRHLARKSAITGVTASPSVPSSALIRV